MTKLRQRPTAQSQAMSTNNSCNHQPKDDEDDPFIQGRGLASQSLISSSPQQHGVVLKLHIPILYSILPECVQRFILRWSFLSSLFGPSWKQRYLILCGSYLYKFQDRSSSTPKGCPFEIDHTNASILILDSTMLVPDVGATTLPPGFGAMFSISTLRRKQYYAVTDAEEALLWVRSVQEAKQESIKRNMGHAANVPYPASWSYFDSLGKSLVSSKARIRQRLEESGLREMEMSNFAEVGPMPRAYHG